MYCNKCGEKNVVSASFCKSCGKALNSSIEENQSYWYRSFNTRIGRGNYFLGILLIYAIIFFVAIIISFIYGVMGWDTNNETFDALFGLIILAIYIWLGLSLAVRRAHDLGKSSSYVLFLIIPLVNIYIGLHLLFGKGESNDNNYGSPPNSKINLQKIFALN